MSLSAGLYIVATPIGNLKDFSIRAIECLKEVDYVACEDTRTSAILLQHYEIKKSLIAIHTHNEHLTLRSIIEKIKEGSRIALVSDAGTPLIQDPGQALVRACYAENLSVFSIPGPCAIITALTLSGILIEHFFFAGFLAPKGATRKKRLQEILKKEDLIVLYEAPHRIKNLLMLLQEYAVTSKIVLLRELTKKWETRYCGVPDQLLDSIEQEDLLCRGEFVVIIENKRIVSKTEELELLEQHKSIFSLMIKYEVPIMEIAKTFSEKFSISKKKIYLFLLEIVKKEAFET